MEHYCFQCVKILYTCKRGCQDHSMGEVQSLKQIMLGKLDIHKQKDEAGPLPNTICKDLNIRADTTKLTEKNMEEKLHDIEFGNFLDVTLKRQVTKDKNKLDFIKMKNF